MVTFSVIDLRYNSSLWRLIELSYHIWMIAPSDTIGILMALFALFQFAVNLIDKQKMKKWNG